MLGPNIFMLGPNIFLDADAGLIPLDAVLGRRHFLRSAGTKWAGGDYPSDRPPISPSPCSAGNLGRSRHKVGYAPVFCVFRLRNIAIGARVFHSNIGAADELGSRGRELETVQ